MANGHGIPDGDLSQFLEDARQNERATIKRLPQHFTHLHEIEKLFRAFSKNLHHPEEILVPAFAIRSYASFLAAARLALSGMVPEVQPLLRNALEYALYANHIYQTREDEIQIAEHEEPELVSLSELWLRRGETERTKNLTIEHFKLWRLWESLKRGDGEVCRRAKELYDQSIGAGAHPNPLGVAGSLTMEEGNGEVVVIPQILVGDSLSLRYALSATGRVGITSLEILRQIFTERFEILSFSDRLEELKRNDDQLASLQRRQLEVYDRADPKKAED